MSALAGDGSVSLSWTAPSFDGNSPITGYKVYRGTSSGGETFLQSVGPATSFEDTSVTNGTTYYYKVSAENALGEGPQSSEAQATPHAVVPPVEPLSALDDFNRANESPLSDAGRWTNAVNGGAENGLHVSSEQLACSQTTTCTAWRNNAQYGPDVEMWTRVAALPGTSNNIRLYARLRQQGSANYDAYMLRTNQLSGPDEVYLERIDNGAHVRLATATQELAIGDTLLLRVEGSTVEGWRHDGASWTRLATADDTTYAAAGNVGIGLRGTTGRLDDFGARTTSLNTPGAPTGLSAVAGNASAQLSWTAPAFDGGSPVTGYRVYRGTSSGGETFLQSVGPVTSFADTGLTNGTTYFYKVSAENAVGEGALSSEASATPIDITPPAEPLVTLDDFDRADENPLSGGGAWGVGANGSAERCMKVVSNRAASNKSTTCTSIRTAQYGPDVEVWSRIAVLPGTNNHIRLKARIQQPGTSGYDGYMLRTNQLSGPDEVYLERIDNGVFVRLLTVTRNLVVGDILLLRVEGSTLEAWVKSGSTWSRLGSATDSTYPGLGNVGIGLRGTTGRLDDFGARTLP